MSLEPNLEEQPLLEQTLQRSTSPLSDREVLAAMLATIAFIGAVAALWTIDPPHSFAAVPAVICLLVLALSMRIRFHTPFGFTVPTQLGFIPLVFALPPAVVPIAVALAFVVARLPEVARGKARPGRLLMQPSNSWFAVGPVAVLAIAHVQARQAGPALLAAALAAQFVADFGASTLHLAIARDGTFAALVRASWVYGIDAALSGVGLVVATDIHTAPIAALSLVPLLGLLALFAHERERRLQSTLELSSAYRGTALVLGDVIEADDSYTGEHCKSVVALALELAEHLGLSAERQRNLEFAALLHDIGKIAIPKEIINKPGKLDPHEWTIIKTHTLEGQKMLDRVGGFMGQVGAIVRSHHERWDGTGYPDALAGEEIPLEARIISCCDTWNAMRTDRSYRKALSVEDALRELVSASGTQLDPGLVEVFIGIAIADGAAAGVAAEADPDARALSPDAAGGPQPRLEYGYAHPAC